MTFNVDTLGFCKPISLPEFLLTQIYAVFVVLVVSVGVATLDVTDYFDFFKVCYYCHPPLGIGHTEQIATSPDTQLIGWNEATPSIVCVCMRVCMWLTDPADSSAFEI